jgi:hypothetical protein
LLSKSKGNNKLSDLSILLIHIDIMAPSATTTTTQEHPTLTLRPEGLERIVIDGNDRRYGDWRDDLVRDGYAVIKGAIPRERALSYANRMYGLLESL